MKAKQKQMKKPSAARVKTTKPVSRVQKLTPKHRAKRVAKKALVPHKENDFRPHLIRAHGLIAVLVIALAAQLVYGFITTGQLSVLGRVSNIETADLLVDTNKERQVVGLQSLQLNDKLSQAAYLKAQDMFKEQYWAHVAPSGTQPWKWFGDVGYNYSYAGENLAKNYPTAVTTVDAWMGSPTHRENVLKKEYTDVGFAVMDGVLNGQDTTLVVALYGAPVTAAAVQAATNQGGMAFSAAPVAAEGPAPMLYFASAIEALSPVTIAILGLMAVVAIVGVVANHYRKQLPKAWQKSWRLHHGMYTFVGMIALGALIILATGGGSI